MQLNFSEGITVVTVAVAKLLLLRSLERAVTKSLVLQEDVKVSSETVQQNENVSTCGVGCFSPVYSTYL